MVDRGTGSRLLKNTTRQLKEREVMSQVIQELKLRVAPDELAQKVTVDLVQDSRALEIMVVYHNPSTAKK